MVSWHGFRKREYSLIRLCNWMFETAVMHDQMQLSFHPLSGTPEFLSSLVDEVRRLLFRACAYQAPVQRIRTWKLEQASSGHSENPNRIAFISGWSTEEQNWLGKSNCGAFNFHFRALLEEFSAFIMDGIHYVALKRKCVRAVREQTWSESVTKIIEALYDIGRQDSIYFIRGLFEDDDILRPHSTLVRTKSPLCDLVSKVQEVVLFFKEHW